MKPGFFLPRPHPGSRASFSRRLCFFFLPNRSSLSLLAAFLFRAVPPEVQTLRAFTTELVVEAVVRCLRVINPDVGSGLSHLLPPAMSARFRLAMNLAQACMVSALLPGCTPSSFPFHRVTKFFDPPCLPLCPSWWLGIH